MHRAATRIGPICVPWRMRQPALFGSSTTSNTVARSDADCLMLAQKNKYFDRINSVVNSFLCRTFLNIRAEVSECW